jgi:hypothetical protein
VFTAIVAPVHPIPKAIVLGGVIAGALDILYAFIFYGLRGVSAVRILQSIAHKQTFPALALATGLLVHMFLVGLPIAL